MTMPAMAPLDRDLAAGSDVPEGELDGFNMLAPVAVGMGLSIVPVAPPVGVKPN